MDRGARQNAQKLIADVERIMQIAQRLLHRKPRTYALFEGGGFDFSGILWYNKTIERGAERREPTPHAHGMRPLGTRLSEIWSTL